MDQPETEVVDCDVLVVGGGMAGRWQVMIHGESCKPIVSEAAKNAVGLGNFYERIFISHLLKDRNDSNRIAGAVGFSVREAKIYIFRARAVICAAGGATNVW